LKKKGSGADATEPEYNTKGFRAAVNIAFYMKDLFDQSKIRTYVKTSGQTGLHIYVPIEPSTYTYSQTRGFAETIGTFLVKDILTKLAVY
jgi:bifunctional non-homologous end joining protein LigD